MNTTNEIITTTVNPLAALITQANEEHAACSACARDSLTHAINAGKLLMELREQAPHGTWSVWVEKNFDGGYRSARLYVQLARELPKLTKQTGSTVANLTMRQAIKLVKVEKRRAEVTTTNKPIVITTPPIQPQLPEIPSTPMAQAISASNQVIEFLHELPPDIRELTWHNIVNSMSFEFPTEYGKAVSA